MQTRRSPNDFWATRSLPYLSKDPRLTALVQKGSAFSEDDKQRLRAVELELMGRVLPAYREAAA